jgi:hypothetical protein
MQQKPSRWNISPALIAPEARNLWKGVAFVAPLWGSAGRGALLGPHGGPLAGSNLVAGSTLQWRGTPYGLGAGISGASNLLYQDNFIALPTSNGVGTGDFTVVCLANPPAEAAVSNAIGQNVSGLQPRLDMFFNAASIAASSGSFEFLTRDATNVFVDVAGVIDGKYHLFGGSRDGGNVRAWVDGLLRASTSNTVQNIAGAGGGFAIGSRAESTVTRINTATTVVFVAGWNRALSTAEMRLLALDPFLMLRPTPEWRGVWTPLAGAGVLNPNDMGDGVQLESPAISQAHNLSPLDGFFAQGFETPTLALGGVLSPAKSYLASVLETPAFTQTHFLAPGKLFLAETIEPAGLNQAHQFVPQKMNFACPFDFVPLGGSAQTGHEFRTSGVTTNSRKKNISGNARGAQTLTDSRSKSIAE